MPSGEDHGAPDPLVPLQPQAGSGLWGAREKDMVLQVKNLPAPGAMLQPR